MPGQRRPEPDQARCGHVVATGINRPVMVTQYHFYVITVAENNKDIMKIILQNHASRLPWKSRFHAVNQP